MLKKGRLWTVRCESAIILNPDIQTFSVHSECIHIKCVVLQAYERDSPFARRMALKKFSSEAISNSTNAVVQHCHVLTSLTVMSCPSLLCR